ncbi:uncharacterized protein [Rutidosis leptorrhynchoides]|uniref:uncharacterized protein n=1 Tax=Rutidosis leptorrhynchoides TaxID=125765 RepID=UPI003A9921CB
MGISKDSKMYKYVVKFIGIMRVESIREKIANLEEFGISEDDVLRLFGSNPVLLCLSVDKVKRNMSFVVTCLKQPANVVLGCPFLLCNNLEKMMKPRMVVAGKIDDMGLVPRIDRLNVIKALRMKEKRFVDTFINCHPPEIRKGLMECFLDAKQVQVLAKE